MKEKCGYTLVVWISGQKHEIACSPNNFCLRELIWSGKGIKGATSEILGISPSKVAYGMTEGSCKFTPKN